jgi:putative endonuclease
MSKTHKQKIGKIGEDIACKFLAKRGFTVLERNYWKKWGEIDIITEKDDALHFVEVKTVSHFPHKRENDNYRPEDNLHPWKLKRLSRTIQTYLLEKDKNISEEDQWQFDVIIVFLNQESKKAKVRFLENIIL